MTFRTINLRLAFVFLAALGLALGLPTDSDSWFRGKHAYADQPEEDIEDDVEDDVEEKVEEDIEEDIEDDVEEQIEEQVEESIEESVQEQIEANVEDDIEESVQDDIEADVEDDIEDDIEDDVEGDIEDDIEDDVEDDIEDDIEDDVEDDVEDDIEEDIEEALEEEIEEGIEEGVEDDIEDDVEEGIEGEVEEEVEDGAEEGTSGLEEAAGEQLIEEFDDRFDAAVDDRGNVVQAGEWMLLLEPDSIAVIDRLGYRTLDVRSLDGLDLVVARVESPPDRAVTDAARELASRLPGAVIDYNHVYGLDSREGPLPDDGLTPAAYYSLATGQGQTARRIGIIDTAVHADHVALGGADIRQRDFVSYPHARPDEHGTAVTSILVGRSEGYRGLIPEARLYAASVFFEGPGAGRVATTLALVRALDWLAAAEVDVINMSLTGPENAVLERAVQRVHNKGIAIVAAVGNDGPTAPPLYPAAYEDVIAVTAVGSDHRIYRLANRGAHVDFSAPGIDVLGASSKDGFLPNSGTSMAAPFVTAVLAAACDTKRCNVTEMVEHMKAAALDLGAPGFDPVFGYGLIRPVGARR